MSDLIVGALLFILGFITHNLITIKALSRIIKRLADKYENGNVEKLMKWKTIKNYTLNTSSSGKRRMKDYTKRIKNY